MGHSGPPEPRIPAPEVTPPTEAEPGQHPRPSLEGTGAAGLRATIPDMGDGQRVSGEIDLQPHDIEVHVVIAMGGSSALYRARFKDEPEVEGIGVSERGAINDLYQIRELRRAKAARATEGPLSGFMRHAATLIGSVTKMGWQVGGNPAISPDADGGGEVTLTLRLARRREVVVFAVDELPAIQPSPLPPLTARLQNTP